MFGILGIMAVLLAAGFVAADDSSAAASFNLAPSGDDYAKVSGSLTYKLTYAIDENMTYKIELVDSDGKSAGSVSVSSGTLYASSTSKTFTVTMPSTAGEYTLELTVTQTVTDGDDIEYKRYAYVKAVDPITLSVTVENNGDAKRSFMAYFYIQDGEEWTKIEGSGQTVTVEAESSETVTYDYIVRDVENTTFCLQADDAAIGGEIKGLGPEYAHTFYTEGNDYKVIEYICIAVLVVLVILAIWIYRKPVKNRGKPKARR